MKCLECNTANHEGGTTCVSCGASLRPARALLYLERAEQELNEGKMSRARADIARFDIEMLTISPELRERYQLPARSFWVQSLVYYNKGQMNEAKRELQQAQISLEANPDGSPLLARILNRLGNINYYQGRIDEAVVIYQRSSELSAEAGDHTTAARTMFNLGSIYFDKQKYEQAIASYEHGLTEARVSNNPNVLVQANAMLASVYSQYGPFNRAVAQIEQALALLPQVEGVDARALMLKVAGEVYMRMGDLDRAVQYLQQAADTILEGGSKPSSELVGLAFAELMRQRGEVELWYSYIIMAQQAGSNNEVIQSEAALQLAHYYVSRNDAVRARRHLQHLETMLTTDLQITAEDIIYIRRAQALLHTVLGDWDTADKHFREAVAQNTFSKYDLAMVWRDYAAMLRRRGEFEQQPTWYAESEAAYAQAATLLEELGLPNRR